MEDPANIEHAEKLDRTQASVLSPVYEHMNSSKSSSPSSSHSLASYTPDEPLIKNDFQPISNMSMAELSKLAFNYDEPIADLALGNDDNFVRSKKA